MLPEATMICQAFYCALLRPIYIRFAPYCAYLIVFAHAIRAAIINLRAAAPAADPGKMGKEETARLTFPICVCVVLCMCVYMYIPWAAFAHFYITSPACKPRSRHLEKMSFSQPFPLFQSPISSPAAAAANRRVARAAPGTKTARHGRTNMP